MIVPMLKYSFLVYHKERMQFTQDLMEVGILQVIEKGEVEDDRVQELSSDIKEAENVVKAFEKRKKTEKKKLAKYLEKPLPPLSTISYLEKELDRLKHEKDAFNSQIKLLEPWGEFSWKTVRELEKSTNLSMRFCRHPERKFDNAWNDEFPIEVVNKVKRNLYFIIFQEDEDSVLPVVPMALPKSSLSDLVQKRNECISRIAEINTELNYYALSFLPKLKEGIASAKDELSLHKANLSTELLNADKMILLEGWCPITKQQDLLAYATKNHVVCVEQQPAEDEVPPVLLKNNAFTKLFEPIGKMFSLPAYSELDLTVYFAPFFLLFFGFCLGDAGYGVVFIIIGSLLKLKIKGPNRSFLTLMQLFGISTTIIGLISGTLFGLEMAKVTLFVDYKDLFLNQGQLFNLALAIGFVQIIFGMGISVYKSVIFQGWLYAFNKIGWIITSLSMLDLFVLKLAPVATGITVWIGVGFIVFFGSPKDGVLKSFGLGLADLYNITGIAGDLLSYIRLFALGVSSAILGLVVNSIALSAKGVPYVGIGLTVFILIVGHTANMMLASLSAFVHPMRLTFVEFYKNTGFFGGGKPYEPLKKRSPHPTSPEGGGGSA